MSDWESLLFSCVNNPLFFFAASEIWNCIFFFHISMNVSPSPLGEQIAPRKGTPRHEKEMFTFFVKFNTHSVFFFCCSLSIGKYVKRLLWACTGFVAGSGQLALKPYVCGKFTSHTNVLRWVAIQRFRMSDSSAKSFIIFFDKTWIVRSR